jgi:hypothetical protein
MISALVFGCDSEDQPVANMMSMGGESMENVMTGGEIEGGTTNAGGMNDPDLMSRGSGTCDDPYQVSESNGKFVANFDLVSDSFDGSCSPDNEDALRSEEAIVSFTAPEAGTYLFSTLPSFGLDTVVYARTSCEDASTEIACQDDYGDFESAEVQSRIVMNLEANEEIFVIVDTFPDAERGAGVEFDLSIESIQATAPTLSNAEVYFDRNPLSYAFAVKVEGNDAEEDVVAIRHRLFEGGALIEEYDVSLVESGELSYTDGAYVGTLSYELNQNFVNIDTVEIATIDEYGLESEYQSVTPVDPTYLTVGSPCSIETSFEVCEADHICLTPEDDENAVDGVCTRIYIPTLDMGTVYFNDELKTIGFVLQGTDGTEGGPDLDYFSFIFYDENDESMFEEVISLRLDVESDNDNFTASLSFLWSEETPAPSRVEVQAVDALELVSNRLNIETVAMPVSVNLGEACDQYEAQSVCVDSQCLDTCVAEADFVTTCNEDQTVINLNEAELTYSGSHTVIEDNERKAGTCGGSGNYDILSFTAETAGSYRFTLTGMGEMVDPLLFVREVCTSYSPRFELECDDDIDTEGMDYNSSIELTLDEGQMIYLFADAFSEQTTGDYVLTGESIGN